MIISKTTRQSKLFFFIISLFASGCIPVPVYIDNPVQDKTEVFEVGVTNKEEIRGYLGDPIIIREDLSIEVFHGRGKISVVGLLVYVPLDFQSNDLESYALVKYKDDILEEFDAGAFNNLIIKDIEFHLGTETLLVPWDYYESHKTKADIGEYEKSDANCKIYIAPTDVGSIFLDSKRLGYGVDSRGFFYEELGPGAHQIQVCRNSTISESNTLLCPDKSMFECNENEDLYFHTYTQNDFWKHLKGEKVTINIEQSRDVPEWINNRKLIVGQGHVVINY